MASLGIVLTLWSFILAKKSNTITKHDIIREIKAINQVVSILVERMNAIEMAFNSLIEMDKKDEPLKEYIIGKHKQEERK